MTNLRDVRLSHNKTVNEVSHKIGIVPRMLQEYEDGRPIPPGDVECINYYFWGTYYPREGGVYYYDD